LDVSGWPGLNSPKQPKFGPALAAIGAQVRRGVQFLALDQIVTIPDANAI
jgi:hypothetical protein